MKTMLGIAVVAIVVAWPMPAGANQLGTQIPSNCVAHISFDGSADLVDDYRCAGLAIEFHTAGVAFSPGPIWAGQWLFVDEQGQFRVGSCTFNRGIHPTIDAPSFVVAQSFPNDPNGAKGAYLTWRYGDTTDDLTAAAMWAVLHFYAQDSAGTRRATNPVAPLIPSLSMVSAASGRDDIEQLAIALDAEATRFAGEWAIAATVDVAGGIVVTLTAAGQPVADAAITLLMSGNDEPVIVTTAADGVARSTMPVVPGTMTVVATASAPGPALVYRGTPAGPDPNGAQRLVTGGTPRTLSATATIEVPIPPTTTSSTTTTTLPPTTSSTTTTATTLPPTTTTTTTTVPATTTTVAPEEEIVPTTVAPETLPPETLPAETVPPDTIPPDTFPPPPPPLPRTGQGSELISFLATAMLVAGIGVVGVAGRRKADTS